MNKQTQKGKDYMHGVSNSDYRLLPPPDKNSGQIQGDRAPQIFADLRSKLQILRIPLVPARLSEQHRSSGNC